MFASRRKSSCADQKNEKTNHLSVSMDEENGGEDVEAIVRFFKRRLREVEVRRQAYEALSDNDRKYISIEEMVLLDGEYYKNFLAYS